MSSHAAAEPTEDTGALTRSIPARPRFFAGPGAAPRRSSHAAAEPAEDTGELTRSITGRLLFFYVLGDVLGSGVYVLIGLVAGAVGGAFWIAFAAGVSLATVTGLADAELATKYPQAAGASLYVGKAFRSPVLTFLITICSLSAVFAASRRRGPRRPAPP